MEVMLQPKGSQALLPTDILFQSVYWGNVKRRLGWRAHAFDIDGKASTQDMLVLSKPIGRNTVAAYVPQGPEWAPAQESYGPYLEALSAELVRHIGDNVAFIRYDLPWESTYAREIERLERYDFPDPGIREIRMNFGTKHWRLKKAPNDMTVAHSCVVDIADENRMLSRMKSKTRYNINLARRKGVQVKPGTVEDLPVFYELYRRTAERNGFRTAAYRFFEVLFPNDGDHREKSEIALLLATHGSDVLAGAIIAVCGKVALFLHGASGNLKRNLMGSYALHWEAMKWAAHRDCHTYDMGAVAPNGNPQHPFFGMYRFKSGFGGRIVHQSGTWDYAVKEDVYTAFRNWEATSLESRGLEMTPGIASGM